MREMSGALARNVVQALQPFREQGIKIAAQASNSTEAAFQL